MKYLVMCIAIYLVACGTDTGNPARKSTPAEANLGDRQASLQKIVDKSCSKINQCHGVSQNSCLELVSDLPNIDTEIGVDEGVYSKLSEVLAAEINLEIDVDQAVLSQCVEEIEQLECSASQVDGAYDESLLNPYIKLEKMLPVSCQGSVLSSQL